MSLSHSHHPNSEHLSSKEGKTQTPVCVIIASGALLHADRWLHAQFLVPLVPGEAKGLMLLIWGPHFDDCLPKAPVVLHLDDCNSLLVGPCAHPHLWFIFNLGSFKMLAELHPSSVQIHLTLRVEGKFSTTLLQYLFSHSPAWQHMDI